MKLAAIHHVAIIVSDYEKSKDFYVNKLGFAIVRENFRKERNDWKLDLRVGEGADAIELEIFAEPNPPKRVNRPEACGLRHLAFRVEDVWKRPLRLFVPPMALPRRASAARPALI